MSDDESSNSEDEITRKRAAPTDDNEKESADSKKKKRSTETDLHVNLLHRLFPYQTVDVSNLIFENFSLYLETS